MIKKSKNIVNKFLILKNINRLLSDFINTDSKYKNN